MIYGKNKTKKSQPHPIKVPVYNLLPTLALKIEKNHKAVAQKLSLKYNFCQLFPL
jgi:hypothetical protein